MAFKGRGSLNPHGGPVLKREIITDSVAVVELDSVKLASGFIALGTTGVLVFGHITGISTLEGVGLETDGTAGAQTGSFVGAYTVAATNESTEKVKAEVDISKYTLYSAELDATIGTNDSDLSGNKLDLVDEDTLSESSTGTSTAQYNQWGVDPLDTTKAIVNIYESQVFGL